LRVLEAYSTAEPPELAYVRQNVSRPVRHR
jgi:hypothetical protein